MYHVLVSSEQYNSRNIYKPVLDGTVSVLLVGSLCVVNFGVVNIDAVEMSVCVI